MQRAKRRAGHRTRPSAATRSAAAARSPGSRRAPATRARARRARRTGSAAARSSGPSRATTSTRCPRRRRPARSARRCRSGPRSRSWSCVDNFKLAADQDQGGGAGARQAGAGTALIVDGKNDTLAKSIRNLGRGQVPRARGAQRLRHAQPRDARSLTRATVEAVTKRLACRRRRRCRMRAAHHIIKRPLLTEKGHAPQGDRRRAARDCSPRRTCKSAGALRGRASTPTRSRSSRRSRRCSTSRSSTSARTSCAARTSAWVGTGQRSNWKKAIVTLAARATRSSSSREC